MCAHYITPFGISRLEICVEEQFGDADWCIVYTNIQRYLPQIARWPVMELPLALYCDLVLVTNTIYTHPILVAIVMY